MNIGPFQLLIIALVLLLLFGRGRISDTFGDFGKGVKAFRRGLDEAEPAPLPVEGPAQAVAADGVANPADK